MDEANTTLLSRFRGVLVGLAAGDALGGPVEFMTREEIITKRGKPVRDMIGGGWLKLQPGETTDDTAMARLLAASLVERDHFDPNDVAQRYVGWLATNPKDVGNITKTALKAWMAGVTIPNAAMGAHRKLDGKSAGNGTIMRCAPLALRYVWDERRLIDGSQDEALITHFDHEAWTGSIALNLLIARLLRGDDPKAAVAAVAERVRRLPKTAVTVAAVLETTQPDVDSRTFDTTGYVLDTLRIVVWALLAHDNFEETVVAAVNCGGDSDTQGAIAGALAGARYGYEAIPTRWLDALRERDELVQLAGQLFQAAEHKRVA